ncbi:response regulator [Methylobacterium organophilum]|uniref:response regulator n=1 Tax=Methylobacterium organophilum TaxID=410 RepID=UPI001F12E010|nr:response regulator [Methylobacterium organophilum]UMY18703.1 response regulator [Methylobacterium organophilum]
MPAPIAALRRRFRRQSRVPAAFVNSPLAFGLMILALLAAGWNYLVGESSRERVRQANEVLIEVERLFSAIKDLETGERGFVIVGGENYLGPYEGAREAIAKSRAVLREITHGAPSSPLTGGRTLNTLVDEKLAFAAKAVALRREAGFEAATEFVRTGEGKRIMDAIRAEVGLIRAHLAARIGEIERKDRLRGLVLALLTGAAAWSAVILLAGLLLLRRKEGMRMSALLDGVLENAPVGLGFLDRALKLQHMNRTLEIMSGRGLGASLDRPVWAAVPALEETLSPPLNAALTHGLVTSDVDVPVPTPSAPGGVRRFVMSFYPLQVKAEDGGAEIEGVGLVVSDETLRRQAEAETRRSEERFRSLVEATASIVWSAHPDGSLAPRQADWTRFTGQDEAAYAGAGWLEAVHPDDREQTRAAWAQAMADSGFYENAHRLRRHDGVYRHMLARAVPILGEDGAIREWVGTHADVSEQKEAALAIAAAKEAAEEANAAKSQFIANMSHELRTPLSAVIGYAEMLQEELEDLGEPQLTADMRKIESNARHLLGLINDVLDLSKIEAERMEVFPEAFAVDEALREVAASVEGLIAKKGNAFELAIARDVGMAYTDQTKLRQCLVNLLGNAAKFTEGGKVRLEAERRREGGTTWLVLRVADTGIGMSESQVERLFERFTQADASTTRRFGGTGLGLSLTRAFAQMLGGEVGVASKEGEGTTFTLRVPARYAGPGDIPAQAPAEPGSAPEYGEPSAPHVLVIDDDASTRDLLARFLARDGYAVSTAGDGRAGLERARALRPRVILLDVTMPLMDGWSVLRALRADPALAEIPVIMVTVLDEQHLAFSLGATDYLHKPIEWSALKETMDRFRPNGGGGPVLVVDDDAEARERMEKVLLREGFAVRCAEHGKAGLEAVEAERPCLILLDLMMPELDGFGFLRGLRARPEWRDIPVVILTAKDVSADDRRRLAGQADRVIRKGALSLSDLAQEVRDLVPAAPAA